MGQPAMAPAKKPPAPLGRAAPKHQRLACVSFPRPAAASVFSLSSLTFISSLCLLSPFLFHRAPHTTATRFASPGSSVAEARTARSAASPRPALGSTSAPYVFQLAPSAKRFEMSPQQFAAWRALRKAALGRWRKKKLDQRLNPKVRYRSRKKIADYI